MSADNWVQVGFTDETMSAGVVVWNGDAEMLVHSPALFLDELLLRDRPLQLGIGLWLATYVVIFYGKFHVFD